jgi:HEPN domain-containing protein
VENIFYLAEQAIEKSLKAVLCHLGEPISMVHEIAALIAKFPESCDLPFGYELDQLSQFASIRRYEEGKVKLTKEEQTAVLQTSSEILQWAKKQILGK